MSLLSSLLMLIAIAGSLRFWRSRRGDSPEMFLVILGALIGAACGSKLGYGFAEFRVLLASPQWFEMLIVGKTVLGGILGGYIGVDITKSIVRYKGITGDLFAQMVPLSIALGRLGCIANRCCPGKEIAASWYAVTHADGSLHWPASEVELLFNLTAVGVLGVLRKRKILSGEHFHLYMISYGTFRFVHEWMRQETTLVGSWTGYQILSLLLAISGVALFARRQRRFTGHDGCLRHAPGTAISTPTASTDHPVSP